MFLFKSQVPVEFTGERGGEISDCEEECNHTWIVSGVCLAMCLCISICVLLDVVGFLPDSSALEMFSSTRPHS